MSWLKDQGVMENYETFEKWFKKCDSTHIKCPSPILSNLEALFMADIFDVADWDDPKSMYNYWREVLGE